ncbi:LAME_0E07404g1_1 [Lachancea meyersii CBS 8951]|uniref:LAME_0E07404g1_1 n=1 Tax=Lachancea meyersii CBS 8951 TaxID=1266667 RepID=A0A1G4JIA9_9SACH|nr:LAME_0E07404g1_1 [Lachancea meyersii CBS 8951]
MSIPSLEAQLDREINIIIKAQSDTAISEAQREIEANHAYINETQLKNLLDLHDNVFQNQCVLPLQKLYQKYSQMSLQEGDVQNWAELVDRDLRVLEATVDKVRSNRQEN